MHFLKSPLTWALLALGIWLNCEYNYRFMQIFGVDAVTTPMLFRQALIGSAVLVAIVCGLALLRGEKFELSNESDAGKINYAVLIIGGVLVFGFAFNFVLNKDLLFITQGGAYSSAPGSAHVQNDPPLYSDAQIRVRVLKRRLSPRGWQCAIGTSGTGSVIVSNHRSVRDGAPVIRSFRSE
jgi:hypothetical protein